MEAVLRCSDEQAERILIDALRQQAESGSLEAQEALCRLVTKHGHPIAREIVVAANIAPVDPRHRALFYFLTEQWDKYEALDFDHTFLQMTYETGDERIRRQITERARQSGRAEWAEMVSGGRQGKRLAEMTDDEWEAVLDVLSDGARWREMWRLAQDAPPRWSAQILQRMKAAGWAPEAVEEQAGYEELTGLAEGWEQPDLNSLVYYRVTLEGHTGEVLCLAISPDGRVLASGSGIGDSTRPDNSIRLWSLPDGRALKTLEGHRSPMPHRGPIRCLAISPNGQVLASGSDDRTVRLWSLPDGIVLKALEGHQDSVNCLAISPDGRTLASGSKDSSLLLWSLSYRRVIKTLTGHNVWVTSVAFSPDGQLLASGGVDQIVRLHSLPGGALIKTLHEHRHWITCLAISPDGRVLASGDRYKTVLLWSLPDGTVLNRLREHNGSITCLAISPDGRILASGSDDHTIRLWRLPGGQPLGALTKHRGPIRCLAISPDGRMLVSGSDDRTVRLWSLPDGRAVSTLRGHNDSVTCLAISPDGKILVSGSSDKTIRLWNLTSGLMPEALKKQSEIIHRLARLPVGQTSLEDLALVQELLQNKMLSNDERRWIEFMAALIQWRRRFDIELEEGPRRIQVGEFDIEIEG